MRPVPAARHLVTAALLVCALRSHATAAAPAGRYTISAGTVYDTKTRLTWQQTSPSTMYVWSAAKTYCASAAVSSALGGTGWRLPTIKELQTVIDFNQATGPLIDPTAFPGTSTGGVWSSTPTVGSATQSWAVFFSNGDTGTLENMYASSVRCVR